MNGATWRLVVALIGMLLALQLGAADARAAASGDDGGSNPVQCSIVPHCTFDGGQIVCRFDLRCTVR